MMLKFSLFLVLVITTIVFASPIEKLKDQDDQNESSDSGVVVDPEQKEGEKFFFPLISFTGSKPSASAGAHPTPAPVPPSQVIVVPQNTTISVASPGQPITVYQSGPTVISSGTG